MSVSFIGDGIAIRDKGDIISGDGSGIISIPVGTNDQILTASSTTPSGLLWTSRVVGSTQSFVQISATSVTANTAQVDLTGIPQTYNDILLICLAKTTSASVPVAINVTFNSATAGGTPDSVTYGYVDGRGSTGTNTITNIVPIQLATGNNYIQSELMTNNAAATIGIVQLRINSYATSYPSFSGFNAWANNSVVVKATGNRLRFFNGGIFGPAGNISAIRLAGVIASGSVIYLYGIRS